MAKAHNPSTIAAPAAVYSHGMEVNAGSRLLYISGQVGVTPDGSMANGARAQMEQAFGNLVAILESAGMGIDDVIKMNAYLTSADDIGLFREVREPFLGDPPPASTAVVVRALFNPEWLVEIEAVAAKA